MGGRRRPRYVCMTQGHLARHERIWSDLGYQPVPLREAVNRTAIWQRKTIPTTMRAGRPARRRGRALF